MGNLLTQPRSRQTCAVPLERGGEVRVLPCIAPQSAKSLDREYKMSSSPRGFCLLINNKEFNEGPTAHALMEERDGSGVDAARIEKLFIQLGYDVFRHRNLKAEVSNPTFQMNAGCVIVSNFKS